MIEVRGVSYPSVAHAAQALRVSKNAVRTAKSRGRLNGLGLGSGNGRHPSGFKRPADANYPQSKPITVCGHTFRSYAALNRAIGMGRSYVQSVMRRNTAAGWAALEMRVQAYAETLTQTSAPAAQAGAFFVVREDLAGCAIGQHVSPRGLDGPRPEARVMASHASTCRGER